MKTKNLKIFEIYPWWIVIFTNTFMLAVYVAGVFIMFKLSITAGILYLAFVILLEYHYLKEGCVYCCYFGKSCAFGKGIIAARFFKKGNPEKFCERELGFKDFIPQILVVLIPLIVGIALLISRGFDALVLVALIYPVLSWFIVNPILYGQLACPRCKQGGICCPALKFFTKKKGKK